MDLVKSPHLVEYQELPIESTFIGYQISNNRVTTEKSSIHIKMGQTWNLEDWLFGWILVTYDNRIFKHLENVIKWDSVDPIWDSPY